MVVCVPFPNCFSVSIPITITASTTLHPLILVQGDLLLSEQNGGEDRIKVVPVPQDANEAKETCSIKEFVLKSILEGDFNMGEEIQELRAQWVNTQGKQLSSEQVLIALLQEALLSRERAKQMHRWGGGEESGLYYIAAFRGKEIKTEDWNSSQYLNDNTKAANDSLNEHLIEDVTNIAMEYAKIPFVFILQQLVLQSGEAGEGDHTVHYHQVGTLQQVRTYLTEYIQYCYDFCELLEKHYKGENEKISNDEDVNDKTISTERLLPLRFYSTDHLKTMSLAELFSEALFCADRCGYAVDCTGEAPTENQQAIDVELGFMKLVLLVEGELLETTKSAQNSKFGKLTIIADADEEAGEEEKEDEEDDDRNDSDKENANKKRKNK